MYIVVFVTVPSDNDAEEIANELIDSKLAACVNIISNIKSFFTWNGKKEVITESLLVVKTEKEYFKRLQDKVKQLHSYDTPEIISMQISEGNQGYLDWISKTLSGSNP